jgi:predicted extracellular nuclease
MSSTPHILANGDLVQDWSNTGSITANDSWAGIASIEGFLGDVDAGSPTAVDPRTVTGDTLGALDVIANQTNPNSLTNGGVAEFDGIANPTIALNGSGTADAPGIVVYLDASDRGDVRLQFDARDLDGSADNAAQPVAVQYRLGTTGSWTNVPGGYDADVTTGGSATESTAFDLLLPSEVNGRADLQVRVLTTNAAGNDEWVGLDNIRVSSQPLTVSQRVGFATDSFGVSVDEGDSGVTTFTFTVERDGGTEGNVDFSGSIASGETDGADFPGGIPASFSGTIPDGVESVTVTVEIAGDMSIEPDEDFTLTLTSVSNSAPVPTTIGAGGAATGTIVNDDFPPATKISEIQGSGASSTMVGQTVIVEAIVVGDFQNGDTDGGRNLGGFYLQEEILDADGNPLTSEGIFVFGGSADLNVGDRVRVTATVGENFGQTQLNATNVTVIEAGAVADVTSMAAVIDLPSLGVTQNQNGQYQPDLEAYEGMLVTIPETLTVTEQFNLDRFNDIKLVAGERPAQFTHDNAPDVAGYQEHLQEVGSRTITYDDGLNTQNQPIGNLDGFGPGYNTANAPRMGDTVTGLTGVLDYQWAGASASGSTWRVRSIEDGANEFESVTEREETPADVGGRLQVGSFNVLNYFRTLSGDTAIGLDPRGANSADEFARQTEKLVNVLAAMDADVLGLIEIENDFLAGSPGNALEYLVEQLNAKLGSNVYDCIYPGSQFLGGDAIAVACIYKPSEVRVALDTTIEVLDDSDLSTDFLAQSEIGAVFNGVNTSRAILTVTFEEIDTGYDFTAAINHFKSKSVSADTPPTGENLDQLDGQGAWQDQRELAAEALTSWLATKPTGSDDSDFMLLGDFNAYFMEDTVKLIEDAGYENLQLRLDDPYSYVFDGQTGSLDYIFTSDSMADQVTGVTEWHINADEADALDYNLDFGRDPAIFDPDILARVSDHDPILGCRSRPARAADGEESRGSRRQVRGRACEYSGSFERRQLPAGPLHRRRYRSFGA